MVSLRIYVLCTFHLHKWKKNENNRGSEKRSRLNTQIYDSTRIYSKPSESNLATFQLSYIRKTLQIVHCFTYSGQIPFQFSSMTVANLYHGLQVSYLTPILLTFWHWLFFLIFIFTLFYFTILYWFCYTLTWIHHGCTCVPKNEPPSHLPPHNISLGHPHAPAPSMLYPAPDIDWRFDSYMIVYMFQCHSPELSHPLPLPLSPKVHSTHLFCCLAYRVIIAIFLNSIYMC